MIKSHCRHGMACVTIYLLFWQLSPQTGLQCTFNQSPATDVPGETIDWGDQCLTEIVDHTNYHASWHGIADETRNTTMAWNMLAKLSPSSRRALTYLVSEDVDGWLQVYNRQLFDMTSDRQWWDDHTEQYLLGMVISSLSVRAWGLCETCSVSKSGAETTCCL